MLIDEGKGGMIENMTCVMRVFDYAGTFVGKCELILAEKTDELEQSDVMIIVSKGSFNPLEYFDGVRESIESCMTRLAIPGTIEDYEKFFDLFELRGDHASSLVHWSSEGCLESVDVAHLSTSTLAALSEYYNSKWSLFSDSIINNSVKADLVALALSQSYLDKYLAEKVLKQVATRMTDYAGESTVPSIGERIVWGRLPRTRVGV